MRPTAYLLFILMIFFSCKQAHSPSGENQDESNIEIDQQNEIKEIYYRFPDPEEMLRFIEMSNIEYNPQLLHSVSDSKKYLDSQSQGLNLGVYIADLAYITVFHKNNEGFKYFEVIYELSDKLRITGAFNQGLLRRFETNMENPDSLRVLSDAAMNSIMDYLNRNNKQKTFALMSVGGFVEAMYLAFNLSGDYNKESTFVKRLTDQKLVLQNMIDFIRTIPEDKALTEVLELIKPIKNCYDEMITKTEETAVTKGADGKLIISGGESTEITSEQFNKLRTATYQVRNQIIK